MFFIDVLPYNKNNYAERNWRAVEKMENIIVRETEYKILSGSSGYFKVEGPKGIGIMDINGELSVGPRWNDAYFSPEDGRVQAFIRKRWVNWATPQYVFDLLDTEGNVIHQDECGECIGVREGIAVAKNYSGIYCLRKSRIYPKIFSKSGNMDRDTDYNALFHDGRLRVRDFKGNWYYVDREGNEVSKKFIEARDYHCELAVVAIKWPVAGKLYGVLSLDGKYMMWPAYVEIRDYKNYRARAKKKGKYGYLDTNGNLCVPAVWDIAEDFDSDGLAFVRKEYPASANLIDRKGVQVLQLPMECTLARSFSEDLLPAKDGNGWGFIDRQGGWAISPQYLDVGDFSQGVAPVKTGDTWCFIDREGKEVMAIDGEMKIVGKGLAYTEHAIYNYGYQMPKGRRWE